jgi:hypothetical protein
MTKDPNAVALGRKGGASRSPAKQAASRANGSKRKKTTITFRVGDKVRQLGQDGPFYIGVVEYITPTLMGVRMANGEWWSMAIVPAKVQP